MTIQGQTPVFLSDCTGKAKGHVLVGFIPAKSIATFFRMCEREFDWECGLLDSGFNEFSCTIQLDPQWGVLENCHIAIKAREFVNRLSTGWTNPTHLFIDKS